MQEVYFVQFHPKELEWEMGKGKTKYYKAEHHLGQLWLGPPGGALISYSKRNTPQAGPAEGQARNNPSAFFSHWSRIALECSA